MLRISLLFLAALLYSSADLAAWGENLGEMVWGAAPPPAAVPLTDWLGLGLVEVALIGLTMRLLSKLGSIGAMTALAAGLLVGVVQVPADAAAQGAGDVGQVYEWGKTLNEAGTAYTTRRVPEPLVNPADSTEPWSKKFASIGADPTGGHTCAVDSDGMLWCWGANGDGQLGDGTTERRDIPVAVAPDMIWIRVTPGSTHTCGITTEYDLYCWGGNIIGQLGIGSTTPALTPQTVLSGTKFDDVDAGGGLTCAITRDEGYLLCWGAGDLGQVGNNTYTAIQNTPTRVHDPANPNQNWTHEFIEITTGQDHACAIDFEGYAYCWGDNWHGQLGSGNYARVPTRLAQPNGSANWDTTFISISAGAEHSCAVRDNNAAYCWGSDTYGSLGNGNASRNQTEIYPVSVNGNRSFASISAGKNHTCGIDTQGRALCWGKNLFGQIGNNTSGTNGWSSVPQRIHDPANPSQDLDAQWYSLAAGYDVSVGLLSTPPTAVPLTDWLGLGLLVVALIGLAIRSLRSRSTLGLIVLASSMGAAALGGAQVTIPHELTNGEVAEAAEVNANFSALADALNVTVPINGALWLDDLPGRGS